MPLAFVLLLVACKAPPLVPPPVAPVAPPTPPPSPSFDALLQDFSRLDREGAWVPDSCLLLSDDFSRLARSVPPVIAARALHNAALASLRCGDREKARALLREALALDPSSSVLRLSLALGGQLPALRVDALREAVGDLSHADATLLLGLAQALLDRGAPEDLSEAAPVIERAVILGGSSPRSLELLALLRLRTTRGARPSLATETCDLALALPGPTARLLGICGAIHAAHGEGPAAERLFERAVALAPDDPDALANLAAQRLSARKAPEAAQTYRALLRLEPDDYEAHLGLALALRLQIRAGDHDHSSQLFDEASSLLARAIRLAPGRPEAHYNLGVLHWFLAPLVIPDPKALWPSIRIATSAFHTFLALAADRPAMQRQRNEAAAALEEHRRNASGGPILNGVQAADDLPPPLFMPGPFDDLLRPATRGR